MRFRPIKIQFFFIVADFDQVVVFELMILWRLLRVEDVAIEDEEQRCGVSPPPAFAQKRWTSSPKVPFGAIGRRSCLSP